MLRPDLAISVQGLSKRYRLGEGPGSDSTFGEALYDKIGRLKSRLCGREPLRRDHCWAVRDVSFDVKPGEVLGIIGRNGAGKSTVLKLLTRITAPTSGAMAYRGRVGSLLEVGTGFHPELTGRENVYLNGAILGMTRREVRAKFDDIVAFAEVERFLDTPVKRYSSGMYVRLAFAVAAHLEPEILLIDEVLAVGDAGFQQRCLGRMNDIAHDGRTIVFVSHDMGAVSTLCDRVVVMDHGRVDSIGPADRAVARYLELVSQWREAPEATFRGPLAKHIRFEDITVNGRPTTDAPPALRPNEPVRIRVRGYAHQPVPAFRITISIYRNQTRVLSKHDVQHGVTLPVGAFAAEVEVPAKLLRPGPYRLAMGGSQDGLNGFLWAADLAAFQVMEQWSSDYDAGDIGLVNTPGYGLRWVGPDAERLPLEPPQPDGSAQPVVIQAPVPERFGASEVAA
ncbi:MAG: polysaccharide ABC transporter ATP-binding protein [Planctomycetota bacterium]